MKDDQDDWIDPSAARRLMLEYQRSLRVRGASKIARRIKEHTSFEIDRKTLENWLNNRGIEPSYITLKAIARFLGTPHFQKVIPRTRDYLEADARLSRIGAAVFDLYGAVEEDATVLTEANGRVAGWWIAHRCFDGNSTEPSYLYIVPVADHPFSKVHLLLRSDDVPPGPGIVFPRQGRTGSEFAARIWSKEKHYREKALAIRHIVNVADVPEHLRLTFEPREQPVRFPGAQLISVMFYRADEHVVPVAIRDTFDEWSRDPLPRDLTRRAFVS